MPVFTSNREKWLWVFVLACWLAILSLLFLGQPLLKILSDQGVQAALFVWGMLLVGVIVAIHAFKGKLGKVEIIFWLSALVILSMVFLRLGLSERSHLIEYSVLGVLIHSALLERQNQISTIWNPSLLAVLLTILLGIIDELLQLLAPHRIFDFNDIIFNSVAAIFAVGSRVVVNFIRSIYFRSNR